MPSSKTNTLFRAASRVKRQLQHVRKEDLHATSTTETPTTAAVASLSPEHDIQSEKDTVSSETVKPMHNLKGPPGWPIVGNFLTYLKKENQGKIHHVQTQYHKKFGPLFREKWGSKWQVHVSDANLIEHIYRNQGKFPHRPGIQAWYLHRKIYNIPNGLFASQGEDWYRTRSLLDKKLLCPTESAKFFEPLSEVTTDFITRLQQVRNDEGDKKLATDLPNECYKWGLECAGVLLFDQRLGCVDKEMKKDTENFIYAFNDMFDSSMKMVVGEKIHQRLNTRFWVAHVDAWDKIHSTAKKYINEKIKKLETQKTMTSQTGGCPFHGGEKQVGGKHESTYLSDVLASGKLSPKEVLSSFSDILIGASDTTSNTVCFVLQLLAEHPKEQARLQEEIYQVMKDDVTETNPVGRMPYLDCVIKETLRLYPLATMQCRILDEDLVLNGYHIPKDTMFVLNHYATSRNPEIFENPEEFQPERWSRDHQNRIHHHPFASMPFGYGKRTCLGKRFARLELHLAISKILQKFEVRPIDDMSFEPVVRTLLTPGKQVPVRFIDR